MSRNYLYTAVAKNVMVAFDGCDIPYRTKGLAIGMMSFVGYAPDIYLPLVNGFLLERFPGKLGYRYYFSGIVLMGFWGTRAAWYLMIRASKRRLVA